MNIISGIGESGFLAHSAFSAGIATKDSNGNDITATYLTGVDLTPYQLTADMTAYQPAGDYLTTADSANFYTTANESGFISEVPAGTMNESAFSYDASDNITAYNGSAFKAGDEFPQSATDAIGYVTATSANIDSTIDNVSANSGAWGGSALPISAGSGIKFEMINGTLVASTDETVLWEGTSFTPAGSNNPMLATATLSESINNFDKIRLDFSGGLFFTDSVLLAHPVTSTLCYLMVKKEQSNNNVFIGTHYRFSNDTTLSGFCSYGDTQNVKAMTGGYWGYGGVIRVVGINRIAGGN